MLIDYINTMALLEPLQLIVPMIHGLYTFIRSDALANKRFFSFAFLFLKRHSFFPPPNHALILMQSSQRKETKPQKF